MGNGSHPLSSLSQMEVKRARKTCPQNRLKTLFLPSFPISVPLVFPALEVEHLRDGVTRLNPLNHAEEPFPRPFVEEKSRMCFQKLGATLGEDERSQWVEKCLSSPSSSVRFYWKELSQPFHGGSDLRYRLQVNRVIKMNEWHRLQEGVRKDSRDCDQL